MIANTSKIMDGVVRNTWLSASLLQDKELLSHAGIAEDARFDALVLTRTPKVVA